MYKQVIAFIFLLLFIPTVVFAEGELVDEKVLMEAQLEKLDIDELEQFWHNITAEYSKFLPEGQKGSLSDFLKGEKKFSLKEWLSGFIKFFFHELVMNGKLLGTLILLTIFAVVLQSLQTAFEKHSISKVAYAIVYLVLIVIALRSFQIAIGYAQAAIDGMMHFMIAMIPLLLALMASLGSITSVAIFHPLIAFLVNWSGVLVGQVVLPLLFLSAILGIVSTMTDHYKVTKLANLFRNVSLGILGVFLAVFLGVISVQGATSAVADGIAIKAAKFVTSNFIPVVGRMFTDATDTVLSASLLLKNAVGVVGVAILLILCIFPAIKIFSLAIIYQVAAAVLQPLGAGKIIDCLSLIGKTVLYMFAALATVCLMFFLSVTIIIAAGNVAVMVR